jgi:hypothetical protein
VGNGIVRKDRFDCYGALEVAGKIVMFSYDFPDSVHADLEKEVSVEERIREAVARKASGILLFSWGEEYPFPYYRGSDLERIPETPIIAINRRSASIILASDNRDPEAVFKLWQSQGRFRPDILISKLSLRIDGRFDRIETDNFTFCFQKGKISSEQASELAAVNEKSVKFITELFKEEKPVWPKGFTGYFPDFDSKLFYTHHWGYGLSSDAGNFMVFGGSAPDFGLAVHGNTHTLLGHNWGGSSSFLVEGTGKYAEAMATDRTRNHRQSAALLKESKLFPLAEMVRMNIGPSPRTEIAYPAAGSFVQYLAETCPLSKLKRAYQLEGRQKEEQAKQDTWVTAFGKPLRPLEAEWLYWLAERYKLDKRQVEEYLDKTRGTGIEVVP